MISRIPLTFGPWRQDGGRETLIFVWSFGRQATWRTMAWPSTSHVAPSRLAGAQPSGSRRASPSEHGRGRGQN